MTNQVKVTNIDSMIGRTFAKIIQHTDSSGVVQLDFLSIDGSGISFYHEQECCEDVRVEDIIGDLADLLNAPISLAEESTKAYQRNDYDEARWTFYRFATYNGTVTIRWLGESSACYSNEVSWRYIPKP